MNRSDHRIKAMYVLDSALPPSTQGERTVKGYIERIEMDLAHAEKALAIVQKQLGDVTSAAKNLYDLSVTDADQPISVIDDAWAALGAAIGRDYAADMKAINDKESKDNEPMD